MTIRMMGAALLLPIVACSTSTTSTGEGPSPSEKQQSADRAVGGFWTTFHAGDIDGAPDAQHAMIVAQSELPGDPPLALTLGMSEIWRAAENARAKEPLDIRGLTTGAESALYQLRRYTELAPEEPRSWAHLGTAMVTVGGATGNVTMREDGRRMVEEKTMPKERAEAGFALGAAMSQAPAGTPGLAAAVDYFFLAYEDCIGHAIDRDAPSFDGLEARRTTERPRDVCFNRPRWPHAEEGSFLVFGDTLEKAGRKDAARKVWEAAKVVPSFAGWSFKSVIEDRLAGKPHEGVGAAPSLCTQCHQW